MAKSKRKRRLGSSVVPFPTVAPRLTTEQRLQRLHDILAQPMSPEEVAPHFVEWRAVMGLDQATEVRRCAVEFGEFVEVFDLVDAEAGDLDLAYSSLWRAVSVVLGRCYTKETRSTTKPLRRNVNGRGRVQWILFEAAKEVGGGKAARGAA